MEHRYAVREPLELEVRLRGPGGSWTVDRLKNISRTGAALVVGGSARAGNSVEVALLSSTDLPASISAKARGYVVWVKGNELGLLWIERCGWERLVDQDADSLRHRAG